MRKYYFTIVISLQFLFFTSISAQQTDENLKGIVYEILEQDKVAPLIGANVYWMGTSIGVVTSPDGAFSIPKTNNSNILIVSFTGYHSDTIEVSDNNNLRIILAASVNIDGVEIIRKIKTLEFSLLNPIKYENVGEGELEKAACCNLSESFETNPSVDVSFTDAITGTKQIQMLGLSGPYTQITRENIPDIRGLSAIYGMEYIPGTWIESIQLNKGAGSVTNGYESIAGQINVELRKPEEMDRLYFNLFANSESRFEGNLNLAHKINEKWSSALLLHAKNRSVEMDKNKDGFMDNPLGKQIIVLNRWKYFGNNGWRTQFGIKGTGINNNGGQMSHLTNNSEGKWRMELETERLEGWLKVGKIYQDKPYQSLGMQFSGMNHDQNSVFGLKKYNGNQQSGYANVLFQSIIKHTHHKYKTGASFQYDNYYETLDSFTFSRREIVPGVFFEYNYSPGVKFDIVGGLRADYHNLYGAFFTPRLHIRYAFAERSVLRASAGKGYRTASVLAENNSIFASSRRINFLGQKSNLPYGLKQESAWNFGASFTQKFTIDYREGVVSFDFFHTNFINQMVVDYDQSPQEINFYNLEGKSYSTSLQIQTDYELFRRLDARLAYRWYDVQTDYLKGKLEKPLLAKHRAFINLAYSTRKHLKFDYTVQWQGQKRIPYTGSNPIEYQLENQSPSFFLMNAQISKEWREIFEVYIGTENLLNYKQDNPIIASEDPHGPYFDSSLIWGPIFGRMIYGGIRLKLK